MDTLSERVALVYKTLHSIPEAGFEEVKTSAFLAEQLRAAGYVVQTGIGGTGVIGVLDSGSPGPVVGVRADMDALVHLIDGVATPIHSCGHDAHSAMVLVMAEEIAKTGLLKGKLKIIFQPAEEKLAGAEKLLAAGVMDDVDVLFGIHLRPKQNARLGEATPAVYFGASSIVEATMRGLTAHGARPHLGINAIDAAVAAVNHVNAIHLDPSLPWSAKVTRLLAGGSTANAICPEANLAFDLRAQENRLMDKLTEKVIKAIELGAASVGASVETTVKAGVPAAVYDEGLMNTARRAIECELGPTGVLPIETTPGGEDFQVYAYKKASIRAAYIGLGCDLEPGLHMPDMHFALAALPIGVRILMRMVDFAANENQ